MLLVWEFYVCIWRGTIITLLQFFFLLCIVFYKITIIIIIITIIIIVVAVIIIRAAKWTTKVVFSPFPAFSQFSFERRFVFAKSAHREKQSRYTALKAMQLT